MRRKQKRSDSRVIAGAGSGSSGVAGVGGAWVVAITVNDIARYL